MFFPLNNKKDHSQLPAAQENKSKRSEIFISPKMLQTNARNTAYRERERE